MIERCRVRGAAELRRIVVAVDPPASSGEGSDACGIVARGSGGDGRAYVLADCDARAASAGAMGEARRSPPIGGFEADRIVAEVNQGGEMVEAVIRQVDGTCR